MSKEWKTIAVSFAITILILFALILGANSQEVREIHLSCVSPDVAKPAHERFAAMKGITIIELRGAEKDRFIEFVVNMGGPVPNDGSLVGIVLVQIDASANRGPARTAFMIIRKEEPSYCSSRAFVMPPSVAEAMLAAVFGKKS